MSTSVLLHVVSPSRRLAWAQTHDALRVPSKASLLRLRIGALSVSLLLHSHNQNKEHQPKFREWEIDSTF